MPQTAIKQQSAQSHAASLSDQLVGAKALSVLESCLRPADALVVDPPAAEEIVDKGSSRSDRACRVHRACIGRRRGREILPRLRRGLDQQRLIETIMCGR